MAIKIKAIEKEIKVGKYQGTYRYCNPDRTGSDVLHGLGTETS